MPAPAFRKEVRAEQARSSMGSIVLIRPLSFLALTAAAVVIAVAVLAYLVGATYAKKAALAGALVPASGAIRIVAPQAGLVRERHAREGARVAAGDALLRLSDARATSDDGPVGKATMALAERRAEEMRRQREETRAAAAGERAGLLARLDGLRDERQQLDRELEILAARESLSSQSLRRLEDLAQSGFVSPAQRQQKEDEVLDHRGRRHALLRSRMALEREIASLDSAVAEAGARSRAQLSALEAQLASLAQEQVERRAQADLVVTAPASGTVATLLVETGQPVSGGASLLTLLPEGSPLEAHLYAPSRAIGFIREGQEVRVRYPAFPYQKSGSHRARVVSVSRNALAPAELGFTPADGSREPHYRVKVALERQAVPAYGGEQPLQAGMQVEADILLDRRRLIEWVFEPLASLAGRA
jgi:membrane fusion protein